jgi:hypothetical protein
METDEGDSRSDLIVDGGTEYEALLERDGRNRNQSFAAFAGFRSDVRRCKLLPTQRMPYIF